MTQALERLGADRFSEVLPPACRCCPTGSCFPRTSLPSTRAVEASLCTSVPSTRRTSSNPAGSGKANAEILGQEHPEDRSSSWFIAAVDGDAEPLVVVDLAPERPGRCDDIDDTLWA